MIEHRHKSIYAVNQILKKKHFPRNQINTDMEDIHISAIEVLEAVLQLKAGRYDFSDFSSRLLSADELLLSEKEILEEIQDLFLPIFRSESSFSTALIVLSTSYKADSVAFLADFYLKVLKGVKSC